ncbi:hypothetical protein M407DRAFT_198313 [Tulasnella calospora MUT 4182]|uniref:Uncharacterized protein n=1 Tax=Tulasnella calospora MUT 4182 TaxID=1051891 RepID=A0A0C3QWH4_9AGAM|nr:hypothetical protein M407DRAFT_198313 [Tulasnella calospora MUT 4182]
MLCKAGSCLVRKLRRRNTNDWKLLKRAILEEYKEASLPPSIMPTSAPALKSSDHGPIPAAASPFQIRIGRIRVDCNFSELQGYISNSVFGANLCTVSQNQSTAAIFEFDVLARTMKFQGTTDDYLAAKPYDKTWNSKDSNTSWAAAVKNSGHTVAPDDLSSIDARVDVWSMVDENKLVVRWALGGGGLLELEPTASRDGTARRLFFANSYQLFASYGSRATEFKPLTLSFEPLS